ncbi:transposase [Amycolatopsis sp. QT-25]|uniref:transposase n=1 Tax=Amycolatopsis sp. QT-25 TaxID=3034022 RepID=UPI0023ED38C7|nr:transposase [Amycolatopsis sp. QT-25]WET76272.1 transposase [Amycolatopsis sp. QT-25]
MTDEIALWRSRPLEELYPILYVDGLRVKEKGVVTSKVATDLRNRGVKDILIA